MLKYWFYDHVAKIYKKIISIRVGCAELIQLYVIFMALFRNVVLMITFKRKGMRESSMTTLEPIVCTDLSR